MAELVQLDNGVATVRFIIDKPLFRLGRSTKRNDICITDGYVSKEHAIIEARKSKLIEGAYVFYIRDLGSTNHTFVNKEKISSQLLRNNDVINIGRNLFRFVCSDFETLPDGEKLEESTIEFDKALDSQANISSFSRRLNLFQ